MLDFSQTIYNQTKIDKVRSGKLNIKIMQTQQKENDENLIYNTSSAYLQVLIYDTYLSELKKTHETDQKLYRIKKVQVERGVAINTDLQRIEVTLHSTDYKISQTTMQRKNALNNLKYAMGLPLDTLMSIAPADSAFFSVSKQSMAIHPYFQLNNLSAFQIDQSKAALQKIDYQIQKAGYLPQLNAQFRLAGQTNANEFNNVLSEWKHYSYVGVGLSIPIFTSRMRSSTVKESRLDYENANLSLGLSEKKYRLTYRNKLEALESAFNNFLSNRENLALSRKIIQETQLSYQKGAESLSSLLTDENSSNDVLTDYINSLYNLMQARLDYEQAKGTLIQFYHQLK